MIAVPGTPLYDISCIQEILAVFWRAIELAPPGSRSSKAPATAELAPARHGSRCGSDWRPGEVSHAVTVRVNDARAHCEQARAPTARGS